MFQPSDLRTTITEDIHKHTPSGAFPDLQLQLYHSYLETTVFDVSLFIHIPFVSETLLCISSHSGMLLLLLMGLALFVFVAMHSLASRVNALKHTILRLGRT